MIHISNWQKKYSATYLGLVPIFEERPGCVFSPSILDVDITDHLSPGCIKKFNHTLVHWLNSSRLLAS